VEEWRWVSSCKPPGMCPGFYPHLSPPPQFEEAAHEGVNEAFGPTIWLGWKGGDKMWLTALALQNSLNSREVNCVLLSLTIESGTPCWAHSLRSIALSAWMLCWALKWPWGTLNSSPRRWRSAFPVVDPRSLCECAPTVWLLGLWRTALPLLLHKFRIYEPFLQCRDPRQDSTRNCARVTSFAGYSDVLGEGVWELGPQRGWNNHTFPEQEASLLDREGLSASVEAFELRPVSVLAE
jgi:hypothetical protein